MNSIIEKINRSSFIKIFLGSLIAISFFSFIFFQVRHVENTKVKIYNFLAKEEEFTQNFIKKYPSIIPTLNRYLDCQKGKFSAVEGCLKNVTSTEEEIEILNEYILKMRELNVEKEYLMSTL